MSDVLTRLAGQTERTITTVGDRSVVRMTRTYDTGVDDLWEAWTNPGRLDGWLGVVTGDLREGGTVQLCMTPPDKDIATLEVLRCDAPRRLVVRWTCPGEPDSVVELALAADGADRTALTIEHVALVGQQAVDYGGGWEDFLFRLEADLAGDDPGALSWDDVNTVIGPEWQRLLAGAGDDGRWPRIEHDGTVIRARHVVAATSADVWRALTRDVGWFGVVTGDLAVGGNWEITWDQGSATGTVRDCMPERSFATSWRWAHDPADTPDGTVTVTLTPTASGTIVDLCHEHAGDAAAGYAAGWHAHLRDLESAVRGRPRAEADWQADWEAAFAILRP